MNVEGLKDEIDIGRIIKILVALCLSAVVAYYGQPAVKNNANAINTIVTIFSILAGFLIAVITFIVEPTLKKAKTKSELSIMYGTVQRRLLRQKILFYMYLLTLGLALAMFLTPNSDGVVRRTMEGGFLFFATFVFLASFALPGSLMKIQMERYEAALSDATPVTPKTPRSR